MRRPRRCSKPCDSVRSTSASATSDRRTSEEAFYSDSQFIGFGFANGYDGQGLRILQVFPESPAAETGMQRGDRITSINGQSVVALVAAGTIGTALGPSQEGYSIRFRYERADGSATDETMAKRAVTIPTVSVLNVYEVDGRKDRVPLLPSSS